MNLKRWGDQITLFGWGLIDGCGPLLDPAWKNEVPSQIKRKIICNSIITNFENIHARTLKEKHKKTRHQDKSILSWWSDQYDNFTFNLWYILSNNLWVKIYDISHATIWEWKYLIHLISQHDSASNVPPQISIFLPPCPSKITSTTLFRFPSTMHPQNLFHSSHWDISFELVYSHGTFELPASGDGQIFRICVVGGMCFGIPENLSISYNFAPSTSFTNYFSFHYLPSRIECRIAVPMFLFIIFFKFIWFIFLQIWLKSALLGFGLRKLSESECLSIFHSLSRVVRFHEYASSHMFSRN